MLYKIETEINVIDKWNSVLGKLSSILYQNILRMDVSQ